MATDLKQKLEIINILFESDLKEKQTRKRIDYEFTYNGLPIAWVVTYNYKCYNKLPTKSEMIYINKIVSNLISIVGKDISIINKTYIKTKLVAYPESVMWDIWINNYKKLITMLK